MNDFTEYKLNNNLRIIHKYKKDCKIVDVRLIVKAGNFYNCYFKYTPGTAHFLEHLLHEKTIKYRNFESLISIIEDYGGQRNAITYPGENMIFFSTILKDFSENAFDYISQVAFNPDFDESLVKKNINIILEEILEKFKSSSVKAYNLLNHIAYENTNFVNHTLGSEESIKNITFEELLRYYKERFVPENCILSVSGDLTIEECKSLTDKYFSNIVFEEITNDYKKEDKDTFPKVESKKQINVVYNEKQATVNIGALTLGFNDESYFSNMFLLRLLSFSSTSILSKKLREEKNLIYGISGTFNVNSYFGLLYFSVNIKSKNIQECINIIKDEIYKISDGNIDQGEFEKTKNIIKSYEIFSNQTLQNESENYALIRLLFKNIKDREEYLNKFINLSINDITKSAKWLYNNLNLLAVLSESDEKYDF